MRTKIAVATVSGRAYYRLVKELKERELLFLSLVPGEAIPSTIKVVVTTEEEKPLVEHPNVVIFHEKDDPKIAVDEAHRLASDKKSYQDVSIGVDPGKTFGIAILCDGNVSRTEDGLTLEQTIDTILTALGNNPANSYTVRIGGGVPELAEELADRIKKGLPDEVGVEIVSEKGTSHGGIESRGRKLSDADSAVWIARKKGNRT